MALRAADPDVLLLFWGAHPDADVALEATWRAASPHWTEDRRALIARKYAVALAGQDEPEFDDPDPVRGWASQYLNVWPGLIGAEASSIFPTWPDLRGDPIHPEAFGIAADRGVTRFVLAGAAGDYADLVTPAAFEATGPRIPAGRRDLFVTEVARIVASRPVALQVKGPAWTLRQPLEDAGVRVEPVTFDEFVQACADVETAVNGATLRHGGQPELDAAVRTAQWRMVEDRRVISRKSSDIPELEAVILARQAVRAAVPTVW